MCAPYLEKLKPIFLPWFIKNVAVYIWLQLCQILAYFNNFCTAETGKNVQTGHAACVPQHSQGRRRAARASDLHVVRTGPVCRKPRHRRVETSSVGLYRRWRRTFWTLPMIATLKITMSKWQHCKFDNWGWLFLFSFAVNVNFTTVACKISSRLKWYKNYKYRLRVAKIIVKNKMSRFLWFTV